ncbi:CAP domain-containing protein [Kineosporia sp. NBRC 101731]|uniref:CAP domain-containing protein n=1 Tax=Kineosporia sp. NBRC 101731 TaxID=3032199 RepID=UPI0025572031|nr:CAP domain-containing protein [Kineosporia sp. NBRC 101731]
MSLTRHKRFRPIWIAGVTAVVVGGSGAAWACNGLIGGQSDPPRSEITTSFTSLGQPQSDTRTDSEAKAAQAEATKKHRPGHSGHGKPTATSSPDDTTTTEPTDPTATTGPTAPGETTTPGETTAPGETITTDPTDPTATTEPSDPDETAEPTQPTEPTEPDETTTSPADPTTEPSEPDPTATDPTETTDPDETTTTSPDGNAEASGDTTLANDVIKLVNQERAAAGCDVELKQNAALTQAALDHSELMSSKSSLSHQITGEAGVGERITAAGYVWRSFGENIAYNSGSGAATAVMKMWMNSAGHKANILNCSFQDIGVAAVTASNGTIWWTQDFAYQAA